MRRLATTDTILDVDQWETVAYFVYVNLEIVGDSWVLFLYLKKKKTL